MGFGGTGRGTDMVVYGLLIVLIAVYQPAGILGWFKQRFPAPGGGAGPATPAVPKVPTVPAEGGRT
jgi:hypothetical protein